MGLRGNWGRGRRELRGLFICFRREAARLRGCDPSGVGGILWDTGGVASLNPRLMAGIPPGWGRGEERMKDEG